MAGERPLPGKRSVDLVARRRTGAVRPAVELLTRLLIFSVFTTGPYATDFELTQRSVSAKRVGDSTAGLTASLLKVAIDAMEAMPARMSNLVLQNMVFSDCDTKLATQRANSRSTKLAAGTVHIVVFLGVFAACSATFKRLGLTVGRVCLPAEYESAVD